MELYFGMKVPNPMKAKTKKMVEPKFAMNNLLLKSRLSAGKNASLAFSELSPFSSFEKTFEELLYKYFIVFFIRLSLTSVSLFSLLASESVLGNRWNENIVNNQIKAEECQKPLERR